MAAGVLFGGIGGMGFGAFLIYDNPSQLEGEFSAGAFVRDVCCVFILGSFTAIGGGFFMELFPFPLIAIGMTAVATFFAKHKKNIKD